MSQSNSQIFQSLSVVDSSMNPNDYSRMEDPQLIIVKKQNPLLNKQNFKSSVRKQQSQIEKQVGELKVSYYYSQIPSQTNSKISQSSQFRNSDNSSQKFKKKNNINNQNKKPKEQSKLQGKVKKYSRVVQFESQQKKSRINISQNIDEDNDQKLKFYSDQSKVKIKLPSNQQNQTDSQDRSIIHDKNQQLQFKKSEKGEKDNSKSKIYTDSIKDSRKEQFQTNNTEYRRKKDSTQGAIIDNQPYCENCQIM